MRKRILFMLLCLSLCLALLPVGSMAAETKPTSLRLIPVAGGLHIEVGQEVKVPLVFLPEGTTSQDAQWTIDPQSVASITRTSADGCTVKGVAPGEARLQVLDPTAGWSEMQVYVYPKGGKPAAESVWLSTVSMELHVGERMRVHSYVYPENANQKITWKIDNPNVATIDENGWVTGHSTGNTRILAYADNGKYTAFQVMVASGQEYKYSCMEEVAPDDYRYNAANWAASLYLRIPDRSGYIGLEENCTRLELVDYLWRLKGRQIIRTLYANPFEDLEEEDRFPAMWALEYGVTTGTSDTTFEPNMTVTRAQAVTFLYRAMGSPKAEGLAGFTDVPEDSWFADAAAWAVANHITVGTGNSAFSPDRECTRGEIFIFLYRLFNS